MEKRMLESVKICQVIWPPDVTGKENIVARLRLKHRTFCVSSKDSTNSAARPHGRPLIVSQSKVDHVAW